MAQQSKKIRFYDPEKVKSINPETMRLWNKYKIDMELRELAAGTQDGYYNDLLHWWLFILDNQGNQCITDLTEDDITEFLYYCKINGNNSRRMKRRMSSIAAFYKFLRKKKLVLESPMEFLDRPKKDVDVVTQTYLTIEQVDLLRNKLQAAVDQADTERRIHRAMQMRCYALFSLSTMARVNAVSNIRWENINYDDRVVSDVVEKEGYIVDLYFSDEVSCLLQDLSKFRSEHKIDDCGYVFVNDSGERISSSTLHKWCKEIGNLIGVPTLHPHDFRHSGATILKNLGMELEEVSKLLNHKSTDVTSKFYIKFDATKLKENKDRFTY